MPRKILQGITNTINTRSSFSKWKNVLGQAMLRGLLTVSEFNEIFQERKQLFTKMDAILPELEAWFDSNDDNEV